MSSRALTISRPRRPRRPPAALRSICVHVMDKSRPAALKMAGQTLCQECSLGLFGNTLARAALDIFGVVCSGRPVTIPRVSRALKTALRGDK